MTKLFCLIFLTFLYLEASSQIIFKIDASRDQGELKPFWASQIIHPTEFLLTDWGNRLLNLMVKSGAAKEYIRIYSQPEVAYRENINGSVWYDWSNFDKMADLILSKGLKLEIVFFGMPKALARYPKSVRKRPFGAEVCTSPPKDYEDWESLCKNFANHILHRYGEDQISNWTISCWNEPDGNFLYKSDLDEYAKMYDYFAKAFKEVSREFKVGGPALTSSGMARNPEGFRRFLKHITGGRNYATGKSGSPIDFISIHTYGGSGGGAGRGFKTPNVKFMMGNQLRLARIKNEFSKLINIPIFVEEWGESSGGTRGIKYNDTTNIRNSQYSSAFLINWVIRHLRIKENKDLNFKNFTFCASGYEKIPESDFLGYRTLTTKNGFHKPILNAYKLLKRLSPQVIYVKTSYNKDDIMVMATKTFNKIEVLLVNYQAEDVFNKGDTAYVKIDLKTPWDVKKRVKLKHWRIDQTHSNAFTAFKELGSPKLPNPIEIDSIKKRMDIELLNPPKFVTGEVLKDFKINLPSNSVSLIEISK